MPFSFNGLKWLLFRFPLPVNVYTEANNSLLLKSAERTELSYYISPGLPGTASRISPAAGLPFLAATTLYLTCYSVDGTRTHL
jgi:hypothetical protein